MGEEYGPLVRLWGIQPSQLPSTSAGPEELTPFLTAILREALPFIASLPSTSTTSQSTASTNSPWKTHGVKTYPGSTSPVHLFERVVLAAELAAVARAHNPPGVSPDKIRGPETWVARRSVHDDAAARGTASWAEWRRCFKEGHAEAERDFTPTVLSTRVRRAWDCAGVRVRLGEDTWADWTLKVEESTHKLPAPLRNRLFPVVQATAAVEGRREFLVVQMATTADYAGAGAEWVMGTVSDARGVLPAWMQKMAVPGQVAKDVDMFLSWIANERTKDKKDQAEGDGGRQDNAA
ncbi:hypothetical protein ACCO45_003649 [Purpureocillium lilacinum]|uniref:Uncharacterized protein n=1 Tax=Purpureocillium lilacinum TaxID=33203 RepID=A0ACC4E3B1_PURLI